MTDEQKAVYIQSQSICALAEIEGMKAENTYREMRGETISYNEAAFFNISVKYCISHNDVMSLFNE